MENRLKREARGESEPEASEPREVRYNPQQKEVVMDADEFFERFAPDINAIQKAEKEQMVEDAAEAEQIWAEFKATRDKKPKQTTLS